MKDLTAVQGIGGALDFEIATNRKNRVYVISGGVAKPDGSLQPSIAATYSLSSGGCLQQDASTQRAFPRGQPFQYFPLFLDLPVSLWPTGSLKREGRRDLTVDILLLCSRIHYPQRNGARPTNIN